MAYRQQSLLLIAVVVLTGCGRFAELPTAPTDPSIPDPSATLARLQTTIFTPTCAVGGCHDSLGAPFSAGLELTPGRAHQNLVGQPSTQIATLSRVAPGSPAESYLIRKLTGTQPMIGERMPLNASPLTESQILLISDWIRRGAPDD
jgi:hypothetical protein